MYLVSKLSILISALFFLGCSIKNFDKRDVASSIFFKVIPDTLNEGESATLTWYLNSHKKNDLISISGLEDDLPNKGSIKVYPKVSAQYSIKLLRQGKIYTKLANVYVRNKRIPSILKFESSSYYVNAGDIITLTWELKDIIDERIIIEEYGSYKANEISSIRVPINEDKILKIILINSDSKVIDSANIEVLVKVKTKSVGFSIGPDDGRFTIGGNGKRLMYGWPIPQSTSHFIMKVNDRFATNNKALVNDAVYYLTAKQLVKGVKGSTYTEITYYLDGVELTQRLIPVDRDFNSVRLNTFGQYYKIEYEIVNKTNEVKNVGINCLVDIMLDNNDDAKVEYNNHVVDKQIELQKASIPNEVYVYQDINNKSMHAGKFVFNNAKQNPDIIYIGAWPYLSTVVWNAYLSNQIFGDVAMLLKWKETRLLPFETKLSSFYYGLKNNGTVNAITSSNKIKESKFSIYFKTGSHHLTKVHQQRINEELAKVNNVSGVVVSGYTDAKGNTDYNYGLSLKRVKSVTNYIVTKGIASGNIIPKAFGESYANFELNDKRIRRCDIVIYSMED